MNTIISDIPLGDRPGIHHGVMAGMDGEVRTTHGIHHGAGAALGTGAFGLSMTHGTTAHGITIHGTTVRGATAHGTGTAGTDHIGE